MQRTDPAVTLPPFTYHPGWEEMFLTPTKTIFTAMTETNKDEFKQTKG
jgi:hypothetical protein